MMSSSLSYKCVNCGSAATALYKSYSPTVLKLTKCHHCGGIVDKYVEYDPVIVMIDLILMSKEAQRHVIFNTDFKAFWKLFIILMMLETYGVWRNDSLITIGISYICDNSSNSTLSQLNITIPESWRSNCWAWSHEDRMDNTDLFIWEKDFYIQFISTFSGFIMFLLTTSALMNLVLYCRSQQRVPWIIPMKAFSLANMSLLFTLPMLVWGGTDTTAQSRTFHYALVFAYSYVMFVQVLTVAYGSPKVLTVLVLAISNYAKFRTSYNVTPIARSIIS